MLRLRLSLGSVSTGAPPRADPALGGHDSRDLAGVSELAQGSAVPGRRFRLVGIEVLSGRKSRHRTSSVGRQPPDQGGSMRRSRPVAAFAAACSLAAIAPATAAAAHDGHDGHDGLRRIDLVSNQPAMAQLTDPGLVNAWGLAAGPKTPLWVSDNGSDQASIYSGATKQDSAIAVARPPVSVPDGAPTGQVFNDTGGFGGARFIFASENGAIDAWSSGSSAQTEATVPDAVFKGLALAGPKGHPMLYATDFHHGVVDVFDSSFAPAGSFTDPGVPAGFAPFGIQAVD